MLKRYGHNTHSFLSLYDGVQRFEAPGIEGYIAYIRSKNLVLAAGDPIVSESNTSALVKAFLEHFKDKVRHIGFIPVSQKTTPVLTALNFDKIHIGCEPVFSLQDLPKLSKNVKQAIHRATRKGLRVVPLSTKYEHEIRALSRRWAHAREIPPMGFLFQLCPLTLKTHKKYFLLVDQQDTLLAFLACSPIYARHGWYLEDLIRVHKSPNGATELLLHTALNELAAEGHDMASLALAPLARLPSADKSHPLINRSLKLVYRHLSLIYHFQTLEYFKNKFNPPIWEENSFCFYPKGVSPSLVLDLVRAFTPGGIRSILIRKVGDILFKQRGF